MLEYLLEELRGNRSIVGWLLANQDRLLAILLLKLIYTCLKLKKGVELIPLFLAIGHRYFFLIQLYFKTADTAA